MNDICMETPNCDWEVKFDVKKGSLENQIENIERLTRIINSSVENTQLFILGDPILFDAAKNVSPDSGCIAYKEAGPAPNGLERRLKDITSKLDEIVSKSNIVNNTLREKLGTMTIE